MILVLAQASSPYPFLAFLTVSLPNPTVATLNMPSHSCAVGASRWYVFIRIEDIALHLNCVSCPNSFLFSPGLYEILVVFRPLVTRASFVYRKQRTAHGKYMLLDICRSRVAQNMSAVR